MTVVVALVLVLAAICALGYLFLVTKPVGALRSGVKTLAVALLALGAGLGGAPGLLVVALGFCALGDWLLSRGSDLTFKGGIAAFAFGHLAYVLLFVTHPAADAGWLSGAPQVWIALAVAGLAMGVAGVLIRDAGALKIPVLVYIPVLLGMAYAALGLAERGGLVWVWPLALMFVLSDLVLAVETFLLPRGHRLLRVTPFIVWPLYWGAQAGFLVVFTRSFG